VVFLNVNVARQVIGFVYLTFIPGFLFLKLLKFDDLGTCETILFSVGFSLIFLMIVGLVLNEFGQFLGFLKPLTLLPLIVTLSIVTVVAGVLCCCWRQMDFVSAVKVDCKFFMSSLILSGLVVLSIIGALCVNVFRDNLVLLLMLILISISFVLLVLLRKFIPFKLYPLVVVIISIALLYHNSLISNYLIVFGSDVPVEHFVFKVTKDNAYWASTNPYPWDLTYGRINAMLSVTILPTIFSVLLGLDTTWTFKLLYPIFFSFVPLGLYEAWRKYFGDRSAFISAFFFMAQETFYTEMMGLNRQIIGELFFVLLLLVVLSKKLKMSIKMFCFLLFGFGLVVSHYGLSEIFLFFILFTLFSLVIMKRISRDITVTMAVLFFVIMFAWYIFTSSAAVFNTITSYAEHVYSQLGEFFNPTSRQIMVLRGLGLETPPTIWNMISRGFAYVTEFLIVIGFLGVATRKVNLKFNKEFFMFVLLSVVLLGLCILLPGFASTMGMTRFYHILLFFLAPFCVLGAEFFVKTVLKRKTEVLAYVLLLAVLIPFFLFQTSFMYEAVKAESWSISLSGYRMGPKLHAYYGVVTTQEVFSSRWLSQHANSFMVSLRVYIDTYSRAAPVIYGMILYANIGELSNVTNVKENEFVYVGKLNTYYGKVYGIDVWDTRSIKDSVLDNLSILYSNGFSEVYKNTNGLG
jgi:uncharacterized membrane protein